MKTQKRFLNNKIRGYIIYIGFKKNGTQVVYQLIDYEFADENILKKQKPIEKKILNKLSNKKIFDYFIRDIKSVD